MQALFAGLAHETAARALQRAALATNRFCEPFQCSATINRAFDGGILADLRELRLNVSSTRLVVLVVLLAIVAASTWYFLSQRHAANGESIAVYYTKLDGKTMGNMRVSLRPQQSGESDAEHRHNTLVYAAVEAVAGPPNDVGAIRFPPGTRVQSVNLTGTTATVDLSKEVERQAGGTFGENGEFKGLIYTVTGLPGVNAVQVTVNGARLETLPGGHLELDQPLHRNDW